MSYLAGPVPTTTKKKRKKTKKCTCSTEEKFPNIPQPVQQKNDIRFGPDPTRPMALIGLSSACPAISQSTPSTERVL